MSDIGEELDLTAAYMLGSADQKRQDEALLRQCLDALLKCQPFSAPSTINALKERLSSTEAEK
jgi:hypothetical protein